MRTQVFVSYSHKDRKWLDLLLTALVPYTRQQLLDVWADNRISPGSIWRDEIENALSRATVGVLLVSPHFLASDFIAKEELPSLLEAQEKVGLTILWVAVSASAYRLTPVAKYQAVNDPSKPLDSLSGPKRNKELVRICSEIKGAVDRSSTAVPLTVSEASPVQEESASTIGSVPQPVKVDPEIPEADVRMLLEVKERAVRIYRMADWLTQSKVSLEDIEVDRQALIRLRSSLQSYPLISEAVGEFTEATYWAFTSKTRKAQEAALERSDISYRNILNLILGIPGWQYRPIQELL